MRRGSHAAGDASFGRSTGMAAGRAAALLAANLFLVVVLLNAAGDGDGVSAGAGTRATTTTTRPTTTTTSRTTTTTTPARSPDRVKVIVANATTVPGAAARITAVLKDARYNVLAPLQAKRADSSAVYFTPGFEREAQEVARELELHPTAVQAVPVDPDPTPVTDMRGADVLVIIGPDLAERARSTTTTARGRTTTTAARS